MRADDVNRSQVALRKQKWEGLPLLKMTFFKIKIIISHSIWKGQLNEAFKKKILKYSYIKKAVFQYM